MVRVTRRRLSALSLILGAMVAVAVAGCSEQEQSGKPLHAPATFDPSLPGWVACSRLILEGDVIRVSSADSPGHMVSELAVDKATGYGQTADARSRSSAPPSWHSDER
jgi:hypothetical protein